MMLCVPNCDYCTYLKHLDCNTHDRDESRFNHEHIVSLLIIYESNVFNDIRNLVEVNFL